MKKRFLPVVSALLLSLAIQAAQPGQTVHFNLNDSSRRLRSIYHMANGQEYIVVDELSM